VKTPALVMQQVYTLTKSMYNGAVDAQAAAQQVQAVREQIAALVPKGTGAVAQALTDFDKKVETLGAAPVAAAPGSGTPATAAAGAGAGARGGGAGRGGRGGGAPGAPANAFSAAGSALSGLMNSLQAADVQPTANQLTAINNALQTYRQVTAAWTAMRTVDLPALNAKLKAAGLDAIK
jgi:hypothetical protein